MTQLCKYLNVVATEEEIKSIFFATYQYLGRGEFKEAVSILLNNAPGANHGTRHQSSRPLRVTAELATMLDRVDQGSGDVSAAGEAWLNKDDWDPDAKETLIESSLKDVLKKAKVLAPQFGEVGHRHVLMFVDIYRGDIAAFSRLLQHLQGDFGLTDQELAQLQILTHTLKRLRNVWHAAPDTSSKTSEAAVQGVAAAGDAEAPLSMTDPASLFRRFDADGSNNLTIDEFEMITKFMNLAISDEKRLQIFCKCDIDGSGELTFDEFIVAMKQLEKDVAEDVMTALGFSTTTMITNLIVVILSLIFLLGFIFAGISAFSTGTEFESVINSLFVGMSGVVASATKTQRVRKGAGGTEAVDESLTEVMSMWRSKAEGASGASRVQAS